MKTVAVIFGSRSAEHDVSIITALTSIIKPLELSGNYRVEAIYIAKDGRWFWDDRLKDINLYRSNEIANFLKSTPAVQLQLGNGLRLVKTSKFTGRKTHLPVDIVFPATHGTYGEDGDLMGLLEMAGVPYVGCGPAASAVAMDKVLAKLIAEANHIPIARMQFFSKVDFEKDGPNILKHLLSWVKTNNIEYPLFVKPAHLGSSIGITRIMKPEELQNAIEVALHYDDLVLVEEGIQNLIEVTLPIMGNKHEITPALLEQPLPKGEAFFDFETKYMQGGKKGGKKGGKSGAQGYSKIPADLTPEIYKKAENIGIQAYRSIGCEGIARVDMLIDSKSAQVYFNEINPLPGGLYAHNWRASGVSGIALVEKLLRLAEERFEAKSLQATTFQTNYLKQF